MSLIKDRAHQYREKFANEKARSMSFSYMLCSGFLKYVAPSLLMVLLFTFALFSLSAQAEPQGFTNNVDRSAPTGFGFEPNKPNTVSGVIKNASNKDYVLLVGKFVSEDKQGKYKFLDAAGDSIEVDISQSNNNVPPFENVAYYIWGTIKKGFFSTSIDIIEYTQK